MKRFFALLVATMLLISSAAFAEGAKKVYEVKEGDFLATYNIARYQAELFGMSGMIAPDGAIITEPNYLSLDANTPWGYVVAHKLDQLNGKGLIDLSGKELTPFEYGDFQVISPQWAIGVILEETTKEEATYRAIFGGYGSGYYRATEYVFYDLKAGKEVGRLPKDGYSFAVGYDGFIIVEDMQEKVTVYDENFQALGEAEYTTQGYTVQENGGRYEVKRAGDGQVLFVSDLEVTGFNDVSNTFQFYQDGKKGAYDMEGNVVMPATYATLLIHSDGYAFAREDVMGKYAILDKQGSPLTAFAYDEIQTYYPRGSLVGTNSLVFLKGYAAVKADGKIGFVSESGEETLPPTYAADAVEFCGNTLLVTDSTGNRSIVAADGVVTELPAYSKVEHIKKSTDGRLFVATGENDKVDILDWHGNVIASFENYASYSITASSDGSMFGLRNNDTRMMEFYQLEQAQ